MKYMAIFDDELLSHFRRDDNGLTLVLNDEKGFTRAVRLKPIVKPTVVREDGESVYITQGHIDSMLDYEQRERLSRITEDMERDIEGVNK